MKELLYIPSGKYFRFYAETDYKDSGGMCWSVEDFITHSNNPALCGIETYEKLLQVILRKKEFSISLYENVEIDYFKELSELEFEFVEVEE